MRKSYRRVPLIRRSRAMWLSSRLWKPRLVFWCGAIAIGLISVGFAQAADIAQDLFKAITHSSESGWRNWLPLIITPLGFMLCSWIALRYFPGSGGSGIPQAIAARHLTDPEDRSLLLSIKVAFGKILLTIMGLFCGASIGREGPTVQIGASIMLQSARFGGMEQARGLILAGSAAGIAAAFNTPLAGIVFAIEEMGRAYAARTNGLVLSAVILAGLASLGLVGNYNYFGLTTVTVTTHIEWVLVIACGVIGGALGAIFSALALNIAKQTRRLMQKAPLRNSILFAGTCGFIIAIIGITSGGATFGTGYDQARSAVEGLSLPPFYFIEKFLAGLLSMASGIPGGIFAPSLSVGAGLGSTIGLVLGTSASLAAVLGMAGYFAGVVQAPMTAFVIILEMTGNHNNVIPLMCASMLGYGTARLISHEPLYHALSRTFVADVLRQRRAKDRA
ncbi:chloride channel protein [Brucella pseudogrignonensis]|uniref:chloride channel protein n=1 Tax=Brucella pseudogrignonensis TaxID=419475 RepID=UPI000CFA9F4F|nr:chloride channel protein [Brucella pseudogrignonensis]MQP42159.1 chloride channel protein [Ochrobactrum sp. MYb237]PQZ41160.1 chloride channel protein [Brucella pseudogrignonensis]PRA39539.1 chloride channel protein [Brucella pseudogrignonensis]PRA65059.1 chloride channel protein [Brucella pseudogrignonensis]